MHHKRIALLLGLVLALGSSGCAQTESGRGSNGAAGAAKAVSAAVSTAATEAAPPTASAAYACGPSDSAATTAGAVAGAGVTAVSRRYVNVNVATLWRTPQANRTLDEPSLQAPADLPAWLGPMAVRDKLWLVGKTETEALYGEPVELLEERGDWARVAVPAQATPQLARGYPGWLPKRQLAGRSAAAAYAGCRQAIVREPTAWLYADEALQQPLLQLSFGTRLPVAAERGAALQVATPADGLRWLAARDAVVRGASLQPEEPPMGDAVVELGKQFLGLPYLWAGASGFGFDCSASRIRYTAFTASSFRATRRIKRRRDVRWALTSCSLAICFFTLTIRAAAPCIT